MIYSVYNYAAKAYDYYEAAEPGRAHAPKPPSVRAVKAGMGAVADQCGWPLPSGARRVGQGPNPKGRIAKSASASVELGDLTDTTNLLAFAGIAYFGWKYLKKRG